MRGAQRFFVVTFIFRLASLLALSSHILSLEDTRNRGSLISIIRLPWSPSSPCRRFLLCCYVVIPSIEQRCGKLLVYFIDEIIRGTNSKCQPGYYDLACETVSSKSRCFRTVMKLKWKLDIKEAWNVETACFWCQRKSIFKIPISTKPCHN